MPGWKTPLTSCTKKTNETPEKPGGCNPNHNPKALEHPIGLPNPQPSQIAQRKEKFIRGIGRGHWEPLNYKCYANRVMNTLQAHGTTTHELSKNSAGQSQPQGAHGRMTAANAIKHTNAKQTLLHGQDTGQCLLRTPLTRLPPGHNSVRS